MTEYISIPVYFLVSATVAGAMLGLSFLAAPRRPDAEKLSAYECGFDPFDDARSRFDIRFYLVAILFIVFESGCKLFIASSVIMLITAPLRW